MADELCPECGAYWQCDCRSRQAYPLLDYVVVEESGAVPESVRELIKSRAPIVRGRLLTASSPRRMYFDDLPSWWVDT